jgi:indolepyruvate decarboxylase
VQVRTAIYNDVKMKDGLVALAKELPRKDVNAPKVHGLGEPAGKPNDKITVEYLYPRWQPMLKPDDIVIAETGTSSMGLAFAEMPKGSTFQNQTLWGSIGWATPAAFGAALASIAMFLGCPLEDSGSQKTHRWQKARFEASVPP